MNESVDSEPLIDLSALGRSPVDVAEADIAVADLPSDPEVLLAALAALEQPPTGIAPLVFVVAALTLITLLLSAFWVRRVLAERQRRILARRWKSSAHTELEHLRTRLKANVDQAARAEDVDAQTRHEILAGASVLARRVALLAEPRAAIAPLSGDRWLSELDRLTGEGKRFRHGPGRALANGPYEPCPHYSRRNLAALLDSLDALIEGVDRRRLQSTADAV